MFLIDVDNGAHGIDNNWFKS